MGLTPSAQPSSLLAVADAPACLFCGLQLPVWSRRDRRTCSPRCRVAVWRGRRRAEGVPAITTTGAAAERVAPAVVAVTSAVSNTSEYPALRVVAGLIETDPGPWPLEVDPEVAAAVDRAFGAGAARMFGLDADGRWTMVRDLLARWLAERPLAPDHEIEQTALTNRTTKVGTQRDA
jgi:hypothetical protein